MSSVEKKTPLGVETAGRYKGMSRCATRTVEGSPGREASSGRTVASLRPKNEASLHAYSTPSGPGFHVASTYCDEPTTVYVASWPFYVPSRQTPTPVVSPATSAPTCPTPAPVAAADEPAPSRGSGT